MKTLLIAAALVALGSGCQLAKPLRNPDSLDNATSQTWAVTAVFANGLHHGYDQAPETFSDFGVMSRGKLPVLTSIVAVSKNAPDHTFSLSGPDLSKLRRATPGGLTLVLFDGGIGCLSTEMKKGLESEVLKNYTREEYFRALKTRSAPALEWTRRVLQRP